MHEPDTSPAPPTDEAADFKHERKRLMARARRIATTTKIDIPTWIDRMTELHCPFDECRSGQPLLSRGQVLQGGCDRCFDERIRRR